jgi:AcrR family transcriptional regulator
MSSEKRKYVLKERAEAQERTRQRIAKAAAELHEEVGPVATTVAGIARRADVSRLTVYKHFPDDATLYPACAAHHVAENPLPDFQAALAPEDPVERVRSLLDVVYSRWYRSWRRMMRNLQRDRRSDPVLDEYMRANSDAALAGLADALMAGFELESDTAARVRSLITVALDFWTWERLTGGGMDDDAAAELMTDAIAGVATASSSSRRRRRSGTSAAGSRPGR